MSTAWKGPAVILREPRIALWRRFGIRLASAAVLFAAFWFAPWTWLEIVAMTGFVVATLFVVLTFVNVAKNRRVMLTHTASGAIVSPRSVQEIFLRRPQAWVAGADIVVTEPGFTAPIGRAYPFVILSAGNRRIERVPLYGVAPEEFVKQANATLEGRGMRLRYVAPHPSE